MKNQLPKDWKWVKLDEISNKISLNKIKIKQKDYLEEGVFPVVDQGQDLIGGYFNDENLVIPNEPPYIIFGDHTKAKKYINFKFIAGADGVKVLKAKDNTVPKYLFYSLFTIKIDDRGYARHFQLLEKEIYMLASKQYVPDQKLEAESVPTIRNFISQVKRTIICSKCNHKSVNNELFYDFSLDIPERDGSNLTTFFYDYFKVYFTSPLSL